MVRWHLLTRHALAVALAVAVVVPIAPLRTVLAVPAHARIDLALEIVDELPLPVGATEVHLRVSNLGTKTITSTGMLVYTFSQYLPEEPGYNRVGGILHTDDNAALEPGQSVVITSPILRDHTTILDEETGASTTESVVVPCSGHEIHAWVWGYAPSEIEGYWLGENDEEEDKDNVLYHIQLCPPAPGSVLGAPLDPAELTEPPTWVEGEPLPPVEQSGGGAGVDPNAGSAGADTAVDTNNPVESETEASGGGGGVDPNAEDGTAGFDTAVDPNNPVVESSGGGVDPNALPYGPDTCIDGYVWREAFEGDTVCVTPETREQAAADNAAAEERRVPGSFDCISGYVWREARPEDLVCVTPEVRDQTAADNAAADSRRMVPRGPADDVVDTGIVTPQEPAPPDDVDDTGIVTPDDQPFEPPR